MVLETIDNPKIDLGSMANAEVTEGIGKGRVFGFERDVPWEKRESWVNTIQRGLQPNADGHLVYAAKRIYLALKIADPEKVSFVPANALYELYSEYIAITDGGHLDDAKVIRAAREKLINPLAVALGDIQLPDITVAGGKVIEVWRAAGNDSALEHLKSLTVLYDGKNLFSFNDLAVIRDGTTAFLDTNRNEAIDWPDRFWVVFANAAANWKMIDPQGFAKYEITNEDWEGMKSISRIFSDGSLQEHAEYTADLAILAADNVIVNEEGIKLVWNKKPQVIQSNKPEMPEERSF